MNVSKDKTPEFKVILVGDAAVGKTSIIMRYQHGIFLPDYQNTIGGSYITKLVETEIGPANLNIWDTAGQEKYRSLVPMYTRNAAVAIIVFDVSDKFGFEAAQGWISEVKHDASDDCQIFVVGNKIDKGSAHQNEILEEYCQKANCKLLFVSALTGSGINDLFQNVADSIPSVRYTPTTEVLQKNMKKDSSCC